MTTSVLHIKYQCCGKCMLFHPHPHNVHILMQYLEEESENFSSKIEKVSYKAKYFLLLSSSLFFFFAEVAFSPFTLQAVASFCFI